MLKYQFGDISVDFERREVLRAGDSVSPAVKELQLLRHLIDHRGQVISREHLLSRVWRSALYRAAHRRRPHCMAATETRTEPADARYIVTIRGEGYSFQP